MWNYDVPRGLLDLEEHIPVSIPGSENKIYTEYAGIDLNGPWILVHWLNLCIISLAWWIMHPVMSSSSTESLVLKILSPSMIPTYPRQPTTFLPIATGWTMDGHQSSWIVDCGLWAVDCGLWIVDCGLRIADCGLSLCKTMDSRLGLVWVDGLALHCVVILSCDPVDEIEFEFESWLAHLRCSFLHSHGYWLCE